MTHIYTRWPAIRIFLYFQLGGLECAFVAILISGWLEGYTSSPGGCLYILTVMVLVGYVIYIFDRMICEDLQTGAPPDGRFDRMAHRDPVIREAQEVIQRVGSWVGQHR